MIPKIGPELAASITVPALLSPIIVTFLLIPMLTLLDPVYTPFASIIVPSSNTVSVAFLMVDFGPLVPFHIAD